MGRGAGKEGLFAALHQVLKMKEREREKLRETCVLFVICCLSHG